MDDQSEDMRCTFSEAAWDTCGLTQNRFETRLTNDHAQFNAVFSLKVLADGNYDVYRKKARDPLC